MKDFITGLATAIIIHYHFDLEKSRGLMLALNLYDQTDLGSYYRNILVLKSYLICLVTMDISVRL